jgi:hypothetical protein
MATTTQLPSKTDLVRIFILHFSSTNVDETAKTVDKVPTYAEWLTFVTAANAGHGTTPRHSCKTPFSEDQIRGYFGWWVGHLKKDGWTVAGKPLDITLPPVKRGGKVSAAMTADQAKALLGATIKVEPKVEPKVEAPKAEPAKLFKKEEVKVTSK